MLAELTRESFNRSSKIFQCGIIFEFNRVLNRKWVRSNNENDEIGRLTALTLALIEKVGELTGLVQASERNAAERYAVFLNIEDNEENAGGQEIFEHLFDIVLALGAVDVVTQVAAPRSDQVFSIRRSFLPT
ncbi:hypothetical protein GCM10007874_45750 [Labrys miyagiensis]|uniref:Uncharacterized protein n=1 Tax=Labrys miyagiensis TaxID=346912 RepID=A0ABQ6CMK6_9HYPH|nr:hypothetical protein [Labrys miyagiensis]GLS21558.1 hypothetical protein GCM10007874_45750 [Labrys miyagiensis]